MTTARWLWQVYREFERNSIIALNVKCRPRLPISAVTLTVFIMINAAVGCNSIVEQPEISPERLAPRSSQSEWSPDPATARRFQTPRPELLASRLPPENNNSARRPNDLNSVIDLALRNNPQTRRAWEVARAAAANFGAARSSYYPQASVQAANGYQRIPFEVPANIGAVNQWQSEPLASVTYTLLDFGRRRSEAAAAEAQLIAANYSFNRKIQRVVFSTESAFYALDGAMAAVTAAQRNLALAQTDSEAVRQRMSLGLATQPELLLAEERVAQSRFDLANAHLMVHDAQADLAVAVGIDADSELHIQSLESLPIPESFSDAVKSLIDRTRRQRPDLAAKAAEQRAAESRVSLARAQFYPELDVSGVYGEDLWNFTFIRSRTVNTGQPQYAALITLQWDLFTGFRRHNDLRRAQADREAAKQDVRALDLDATAEVWRAYYEFKSSLSKCSYAQSLIASAQESYQANSETYRQGLTTIVELLTAERDLANARYILVRTKAEVLTAYAAVAYASGASQSP
ncbi:MAG: TolC family protein [Candidatus Binataceae bacterium]|nr:TolC family protein [Candidatus Binataceae bacterium]